MEADWEVEVGGGAPVIEADWPGFLDLRGEPERVNEIEEVAKFASLGKFLKALNAPASPVWTAKCDVWHAETGELCCYVDQLPVEGRVFAVLQDAEKFCREAVVQLSARPDVDSCAESRVDLVIRAAVAGKLEGFGVTAYLSAGPAAAADAEAALGAAMDALADAVLLVDPRAGDGSKLQ